METQDIVICTKTYRRDARTQQYYAVSSITPLGNGIMFINMENKAPMSQAVRTAYIIQPK